MSFTNQLKQFTADMMTKMPSEILEKMAIAMTELNELGVGNQALKVGDTIPLFELPNVFGEKVQVQNLLTTGKLVISFYRGGWCPYCNFELRALQQVLPEIQAQGAQLVAIAPETPDHSLSTAEKLDLKFTVLSDQGQQVARQFGLVFTLPELARPIYQSFGFDLPAYNGDNSFELPIPATYVVDETGKIIYDFVNIDYTKRADPEEIIAILKPTFRS